MPYYTMDLVALPHHTIQLQHAAYELIIKNPSFNNDTNCHMYIMPPNHSFVHAAYNIEELTVFITCDNATPLESMFDLYIGAESYLLVRCPMLLAAQYKNAATNTEMRQYKYNNILKPQLSLHSNMLYIKNMPLNNTYDVYLVVRAIVS